MQYEELKILPSFIFHFSGIFPDIVQTTILTLHLNLIYTAHSVGLTVIFFFKVFFFNLIRIFYRSFKLKMRIAFNC